MSTTSIAVQAEGTAMPIYLVLDTPTVDVEIPNLPAVQILAPAQPPIIIQVTGSPGPPSTTPGPPGPPGLNPKGPWLSTAQYQKDDLVTSGGSSYLAVAPSLNVDPSADLTTNPISSLQAPSPIPLGSPTTVAAGFTVDRVVSVYALLASGMVGQGYTGLIGIAQAINVPGVGIDWMAQAVPDENRKVTFPEPVVLAAGVRYWLVIKGAQATIQIDQYEELVSDHMTSTGEFWYGTTEPTNDFGIYGLPVVLYGASADAPWRLFVSKGEASTIAGPPGPPGQSNSTFAGEWNWTTKTANADAAGQIGMNGVDWALSTFVNVNQQKRDNTDTTPYLEKIEVGDQIHIRAKSDSTRYALYEVTGTPVDQGLWWQIPVTVAESGGAVPLPNSATILTVLKQGGVGLDQDTADARYVNLDGDTMTGPLTAPDIGANTVSAYLTPTAAEHLTRKDYVDTKIAPQMVVVNHGSDPNVARPAGAAAVYWIGSVAPVNAALWDQWVNTA